MILKINPDIWKKLAKGLNIKYEEMKHRLDTIEAKVKEQWQSLPAKLPEKIYNPIDKQILSTKL